MAEIASQDLFSLKWNNFSDNFATGFASHLSEKNLVDVTLAVEGHLLQAHKLVLSICSPYFKNIFKENPCQHPVVILNDMKHTDVMALLRFMYLGEINIKQEDLEVFFKVAQTLQIKGLTKTSDDNEGAEGVYENSISYDTQPKKRAKTSNSSLTDNYSSLSRNVDQKTGIHEKVNYAKRKIDRKKKIDISTSELNTNETAVPKREYNSDSDESFLVITDNESEPSNMPNSGDTSCLGNEEQDTNTNENHISQNINEWMDDQKMNSDNIEPVTYRLSARGRPQLVHAGYVYNLTSRSPALNTSHYRCAEQHRGCKGKCAVIAERFMPTGVHEHNHPPGYQTENTYKKKKKSDAESMRAAKMPKTSVEIS